MDAKMPTKMELQEETCEILYQANRELQEVEQRCRNYEDRVKWAHHFEELPKFVHGSREGRKQKSKGRYRRNPRRRVCKNASCKNVRGTSPGICGQKQNRKAVTTDTYQAEPMVVEETLAEQVLFNVTATTSGIIGKQNAGVRRETA